MLESQNVTNQDVCGIVPVNQCWGEGISGGTEPPSVFNRINRLWETYYRTPATVDHERACLVTEAYKKFDGLPQALKMAEVLAHVLRNISIRIYDDELIVGEMGAPDKACPVVPEFSYSWVVDELRNFPIKDRDYTQYDYSDETEQRLLELEDYWKNNTLDHQIISMMSDDEIKGTHLGRGVYALNLYMHAESATHPRFIQNFLPWVGKVSKTVLLNK